MVKQTFVLAHDEARRRALDGVRRAPEGHVVQIKEPTRTLEQNAMMWPLLERFSQQLKWPVNGSMTTLTPDEWKDILTAAFRRESPRIAMGLEGGMVMLGMRTSEMDKRQFSEFLEFVLSVAADRGVVLDEVPA